MVLNKKGCPGLHTKAMIEQLLDAAGDAATTDAVHSNTG